MQIRSESLKNDSHPKSFVQDRVPTAARAHTHVCPDLCEPSAA
jgi:hypothetical protein